MIRAGSATYHLGPHSYSGSYYAVDGTTLPPSGPAVVVDGDEVELEYSLPGWRFSANATRLTGENVEIAIEASGDGRFRMVAPAQGAYDVWLYGEQTAGERYTFAGFAFRWNVPVG